MRFHDVSGNEVVVPASRAVVWRPSAYALVVRDKKVLVILSHRDGKWSFPGGGAEIHESLEECLKREVFEETGRHVVVGSRAPFFFGEDLFYARDVDTYFHSLLFAFVCSLAPDQEEGSPIDADEVQETRWVSFDELDGLGLNTLSSLILEEWRAARMVGSR